MTNKEIFEAVELAHRKLDKRFPDHICAMANKVSIESGKLAKSCDDYKYDIVDDIFKRSQIALIKQGAINLIATTIQFLNNVE